jgi:hypothetical protein
VLRTSHERNIVRTSKSGTLLRLCAFLGMLRQKAKDVRAVVKEADAHARAAVQSEHEEAVKAMKEGHNAEQEAMARDIRRADRDPRRLERPRSKSPPHNWSPTGAPPVIEPLLHHHEHFDGRGGHRSVKTGGGSLTPGRVSPQRRHARSEQMLQDLFRAGDVVAANALATYLDDRSVEERKQRQRVAYVRQHLEAQRLHLLDRQQADREGLDVLLHAALAKVDALYADQLATLRGCVARAQAAVEHAVHMYGQVTVLDDGKTRPRAWPRPSDNTAQHTLPPAVPVGKKPPETELQWARRATAVAQADSVLRHSAGMIAALCTDMEAAYAAARLRVPPDAADAAARRARPQSPPPPQPLAQKKKKKRSKRRKGKRGPRGAAADMLFSPERPSRTDGGGDDTSPSDVRGAPDYSYFGLLRGDEPDTSGERGRPFGVDMSGDGDVVDSDGGDGQETAEDVCYTDDFEGPDGDGDGGSDDEGEGKDGTAGRPGQEEPADARGDDRSLSAIRAGSSSAGSGGSHQAVYVTSLDDHIRQTLRRLDGHGGGTRGGARRRGPASHGPGSAGRPGSPPGHVEAGAPHPGFTPSRDYARPDFKPRHRPIMIGMFTEPSQEDRTAAQADVDPAFPHGIFTHASPDGDPAVFKAKPVVVVRENYHKARCHFCDSRFRGKGECAHNFLIIILHGSNGVIIYYTTLTTLSFFLVTRQPRWSPTVRSWTA